MSGNIDGRSESEFVKSIALAQHTVYKNFLSELSLYPIVAPTQVLLDESAENCLRLFCLEELSCKSGEDIFQKLSTVYNASMSLGCSLVMMIDVENINAPAKIYIGVRNNGENNEARSRLITSFTTLKKSLSSNFPGTKFHDIPSKNELPELLDNIFSKEARYISSVSCVASSRDKTKTENKDFIQGLERFIDTMRGNTYTAVFIAEPVSNSEQMAIRNGYETLYTTLSPFSKSTWSYNENESKSVTESLSKGISKSISEGTSKTQSHTKSFGLNVGIDVGRNKDKSLSLTTDRNKTSPTGVSRIAAAGNAMGSLIMNTAENLSAVVQIIGTVLNVVGAAAQGSTITKGIAGSISNSIGKSLGLNGGLSGGISGTSADTNFDSETTTHSETKTNSNTNTIGTGKTLQVENITKSVVEMLSRIDEQLKRAREGEDYGAYSCAAYFVSSKQESSLLAANTYRALMLGEGSSVESSAINLWSGKEEGEQERFNAIKEYLHRFVHPVFAMPVLDDSNDINEIITYTPGTIVSGLELPLHLGLPTKSVYGLPVLEHAEFGRNIVTYNNVDKYEEKIHIGSIFHMNSAEKTDVSLLQNSLSSHVFITGSTGAGKSNTIYKILDEAMSNKVNFLVVEPAKGEYKNVFGNFDNVSVYGTNPKITPLLRLDPFSFPKDIHVLEHLDRLVEIFNVCWPMYAAMPAVLKNAVEKAYGDCGWNLTESTNELGENLFPNFADVARNVKFIIDSSEYDSENKGAYKGSLLTRLNSLTNGINGLIFNSSEISAEDLFDRNVIVDLSRVGSNETKSLIMGMLVLKLQEYRMTSGGMNSGLKHITVLEEAHNLLKRTSTEQPVEGGNLLGKSVEMLANSIAEMRTYGEGFIIADQAPGLLDMSVIRNTNTKIILRLPDQSDRELVGRAANLNENQITELAKLPCGVAAVYQNEWIQPVLCKVDRVEYHEEPYIIPDKKSAEKFTVDPNKALEIAELLSKGETKSREAFASEINPVLEQMGITCSVRVSIFRMLQNPPKEPRMTRLAPIMSALFPKVRKAIEKAYSESRDPMEWTVAGENVLSLTIQNLLCKDIIQAIVTDYVYNELGRTDDVELWTKEGLR